MQASPSGWATCRRSANTPPRSAASSPIDEAPAQERAARRALGVRRLMSKWLTGLRLAGYGGAYFFAAGAFMSYWPVWLRDRGVTDTEIGTLFMSRQII